MENIKHKILLIEDDKLDQMAFKRSVEDANLLYDCTIAGSVAEARSILDSERFDIVISDYSLGDGTAFDIFDLAKDIPVILITGAGDQEVAINAWRAGAYDYIIKDRERNYLKTLPITIENTIKHKKAKDKLSLLSAAIMSTNDSVYITDMEDRIVFVNRAFCETYGYSEEEIVGKDSDILWIVKPQSDNIRNICRGAENNCEIRFFHKRKDGNEFPVSLSRSLVRDEDGNEIAIIGVAHDISENIFAEDKVRALNLKLIERNRL